MHLRNAITNMWLYEINVIMSKLKSKQMRLVITYFFKVIKQKNKR